MYRVSGEKRERVKEKVRSLSVISRLLQPVKITVFPSFCQICGNLLEDPEEKVVCQKCLSRVIIHRGQVCEVCGRFFYHGVKIPSICLDCGQNPPPFSKHRSLGPYQGRLKELIILLKYKGGEPLSRPLAGLAFNNFKDNGFFQDIDYILPVPLHKMREKERGYNQAELLGRELGKLIQKPVLKHILIKSRNTPAQVSLEAREREINLKGAFSVRKKDKIKGATVLLIDDVYTTGSTLRECALVLQQAGVKEIKALTLARA